MSKTYVLKSWNEVKDHHFISKERWNKLANRELKVEFLDGFLSTTALIHPNGEEPTFGNTFLVNKDDLRECVKKAPTDKPKKSENPEEKTYTKDDVRKAGMKAMQNIEDLDDAIASAVAISKLIHELN